MLQTVESITGVVNASNEATGELNAGSVSFGTKNYDELGNKPSINGVELVGNKTLDELGVATKEDIENAIQNSVTAALEGEY